MSLSSPLSMGIDCLTDINHQANYTVRQRKGQEQGKVSQAWNESSDYAILNILSGRHCGKEYLKILKPNFEWARLVQRQKLKSHFETNLTFRRTKGNKLKFNRQDFRAKQESKSQYLLLKMPNDPRSVYQSEQMGINSILEQQRINYEDQLSILQQRII
ncbi:unnamed protein product [Paramecium sonneborni]|uniref:Uncharacterized protein n=1 Tax=Paramecium sonneborni TaxID=65129 RepID=A0A8S1QFD3_9CILI|nr:unnamed protein product [Paramecium sonneborni]